MMYIVSCMVMCGEADARTKWIDITSYVVLLKHHAVNVHCIVCVRARQIHILWWYDTVLLLSSVNEREKELIVRLNKLNWSGNTSFTLNMAKIIHDSLDKNYTDTHTHPHKFRFMRECYFYACILVTHHILSTLLLLNSRASWKLQVKCNNQNRKWIWDIVWYRGTCSSRNTEFASVRPNPKKLWQTKLTEIISYFRVKFVN